MTFYKKLQDNNVTEAEIPTLLQESIYLFYPPAEIAADALSIAYGAAVGFKEFYFDNATCYRSGELAMIAFPIVLTGGTILAVKGAKLFGRLKRMTKLTNIDNVKGALEAVTDAKKTGKEIVTLGDGSVLIDNGAEVEKQLEKVADDCNITGGCFEKGTLVQTPLGTNAIEKLCVGDSVYAYNTATQKAEIKPITKVYTRQTNQLLTLYTSTDTIYTTTEHRFLIDTTWAEAQALQTGQNLQCNHEQTTSIQQIAKVQSYKTVYNFEVADLHTYFVGKAWLITHNASRICGPNRWRQQPNATYGRKAPNDPVGHTRYTYSTDANGRVSKVSGELTLDKAIRNEHDQGNIGRTKDGIKSPNDDRLDIDHGGHLIGSQFGGVGTRENLVPMNGKEVNAYGDKGGAFGKLEKAWADALKAGKTVHIEIECIYDTGNTTIRPDKIKVTHTIGGIKNEVEIINPK